MQRYFFNLADDAYPVDLQGIELLDITGAEAEAIRFADDVFDERPDLVSSTGRLNVEVTDHNHDTILILSAKPLNRNLDKSRKPS